jgi:thymidylate kinase
MYAHPADLRGYASGTHTKFDRGTFDGAGLSDNLADARSLSALVIEVDGKIPPEPVSLCDVSFAVSRARHVRILRSRQLAIIPQRCGGRMLITVSGIVGSGKSTLAKQIVALGDAGGVRTHHLGFQSLPCFHLLASRATRARARKESTPAAQGGPRWIGYRRRRLTARAALVYIARVIAFRLYRLSWKPDEWYVSNRYFYDLFVHFHLATRTERAWFALIRRSLPVPDLAILATAAPDTIAARRPAYSAEYMTQVGRAYSSLPAIFPAVVEIRTDPDAPPTTSVLESLLLNSLPRSSRARFLRHDDDGV